MPGFVEVRTKTEAVGVAHEPAVNRSVDLDCTIGIFGINRAAADVKIERAAGEVRTVDCQTRAAGIG